MQTDMGTWSFNLMNFTGVYIVPLILKAFPCPIWNDSQNCNDKITFFAFHFPFLPTISLFFFLTSFFFSFSPFSPFSPFFSSFSSLFPHFLPFFPPLLKSFPMVLKSFPKGGGGGGGIWNLPYIDCGSTTFFRGFIVYALQSSLESCAPWPARLVKINKLNLLL